LGDSTNPHGAGLFPPDDPDRAAALATLQTPPATTGQAGTRWSLATLLPQPVFDGLSTVSGLWRRLDAWGLPYKRSRDHLHSPDPDYLQKMLAISAARLDAVAHPDTTSFLYSDEFTYYRQPEPGYAYGRRGSGGQAQPLADRSTRSNTHRRIIGALDAVTGQVVTDQATRLSVDALARFLRHLRAVYGPTRRLTLAWDNWPNHHHAVVHTAAERWAIQLLYLPTYAPWTNPIEKLWHQLKAEVLRLHREADTWDVLTRQVTHWLTTFAHGSTALIRYVGLAPYAIGEPAWV
jgi:transposase